MMYLVVLSWAYQYAKKYPKPLNKTSGVWLQKYAPGMGFGFVVVVKNSWSLRCTCVIDFFFFSFFCDLSGVYFCGFEQFDGGISYG